LSLVDLCNIFNADVHNSTVCVHKTNESYISLSKNLKLKSASEDFYSRIVLGLKDDSSWGDMGSLQPHLVICLVVAWVLVALCLMKGLKSSGKVVYFTALYPYVILIIFLVLGLTLEGSVDGIMWYITPNGTLS